MMQMKGTGVKLFCILLCLVALAVLTAGCGGSETPGDDVSPEEGAPEEETPEVTGKAKRFSFPLPPAPTTRDCSIT